MTATRRRPPCKRLEFAHTHPGRVENERGKSIGGGEEADDGLDVLSGWRLRLHLRLAWKLHGGVTRWVGLDFREVEHLGQRRERLANAFSLAAARVEIGDQRIDVDDLELVEPTIAETGEDAVQVDGVSRSRSFGDVPSRVLPALGDGAERGSILRCEESKLRNPESRELPGDEVAASLCVRFPAVTGSP